MLSYFVDTVATAYETFESRTASDRIHGTQQERVRDYVLHHADSVFRISDIRAALPGVSDQTILLALRWNGLFTAHFTETSVRKDNVLPR